LPKVVAIIPALNEEKGLPAVVSGLKKQGVEDIVVIDNGSIDRTAEIAEKAGARVLSQPVRGKGNAFKFFLKNYPVKRDYFYVMLDADASYAPKEIHRILDGLDDYDVVSGKRQLLIHDARSLVHVIGALGISLIGSLLFLKWNPDICTGYWGFRGSALKRLNITAEKFELEANLFTQSCKKGLSIKTVPISYEKRVGEAKLKLWDSVAIVSKLVKERFSPY
jgi:dolichol-phosphate mannosyltransferase